MAKGVMAHDPVGAFLYLLLGLLFIPVMPEAAQAAKPAPRCQARIVPSEYTTVDVSPRSNLPGVITKLGITRAEADAALKALKARADLKTVPELSRLIVVRRPDACNA